MDEETRSSLKAQLFGQVKALGIENALFPIEAEAIDQLIVQLEQLNPTPHPLHPDSLTQLLGRWELIYASRGTVVTRRLVPFSSGLGATGISIRQIWQTFTAPDTRAIAAENGADLELPLLRKWRLRAEGKWRWQEEAGQVATVRFNAFAIQTREAFGQSQWQLPELKIPVLDFL